MDSLPSEIGQAVEEAAANKAVKNSLNTLSTSGIDLKSLGVESDGKGGY
jgi:hypothetical protein